MATQIQLRRDTASNWTSNNPTLAAGEFGWESDTNKFKIGTGSAAWNSLGYASGGDNAGITFVGDDSTGTLVNQNETFKVTGTQNITAVVSGDTLTLTGPDLSTYISDSSTTTLTNKTIDADNNTISNIEVDNLKSGVLDTDLSSVAATDTTLASAKAIKSYVDSQVETKDALSELSGDTDDVSEGSTNLYFTNARADARITNALLDEDNMASDSATKVPSQQSVKAYVDAQDANIASDTLTFTNKSGNISQWTNDSNYKTAVSEADVTQHQAALSVTESQISDLGSYITDANITVVGDDSTGTSFSAKDNDNIKIAGGTNITTAVSGDTVTITGPDTSSFITASSTDTFTNKTIDANGTGNSISNIEVADLASGVLDTDISTVSGSDDTLASAKAIKTYVDAQVATKDALSELSGDTDDVSEGSTNLYFTNARARSSISASGSIGYNSSTGALTYTQGNTDTVSEGSSNLYFTDARADARVNNAIIDEDNMSSNSATKVPSQQSVKAYVDAEVAGVVDSAPGTLDTLNELAAALGDDANFATTTSTALGNRLRIDTNAQGLTSTQKTNAATNLGLNAVATSGAYSDLSGTPTIPSNNNQLTNGAGYITDSNLTIVGDDSSGVTFSAKDNDNIKIAGGTNITTAASGDTVTITGPDTSSFITASSTDTLTNKSGNISQWTNDSNYLTSVSEAAVTAHEGALSITESQISDLGSYTTASSTDTLTNKTFNANGTGNSITNLEVADFATGIVDTDLASVSASDNTLASAKAIKSYVDTQVAGKDNTDEITEGSSNLYFTDARARAAISENSTQLAYNSSTGVLTYTQGDTDTVAEGSSNLYYTDARAQAVSINNVSEDTTPQLGGNLDLNSNNITGTGNISTTGTLALTNTTTDDSLLITTTEDSSTAAPVITMKRNSGSPADGDYLGQIKFKGENDADQEVIYAKMTGKISDASDSSEDGLIEFTLKKAGANNIGARLTSTELKLINGTGLEVAGLTYPTSDGTNGQFLTTNGSGTLSFADAPSSIANVSEDTTPQLGGNLDLNGNDIVTTSNADIELAANGTGKVVVKGNTNPGTIVLNCESNSHGQTIKSQPHSANVTNELTLPAGGNQEIVGTTATQTLTNKTIDADNNTVSNIEVDNFKAASIVTEAEGIGSNDNDTTIPTSAAVKNYVDSNSGGGGGNANTGDLTFNGSTMSAPSNADLTLQPGGTGNVVIDGLTYPGTDGTNGQVLTTNGSGTLSFTTVSGGGGASTGDFTFTGNNMSTSSSNADMELGTSGTGMIVLKGNGGPTPSGSANRYENANVLSYYNHNVTPGSTRFYKNHAHMDIKLDGSTSSSSNDRFRAFNAFLKFDINGSELTNTGGSRGPMGVGAGTDVINSSSSTATIGNIAGVNCYNYVYNGASSGNGNVNITNAQSFRSYSPAEFDGISGTVTNAYGFYTGSPIAYAYNNSNLTVTNSYGFYYRHNPDNAVFTNDPYAFYTNDDSVRSNPGALNKFNEYSYNTTHSANGAYTIDWANGNLQTVTLGANITGFTMSNFPTSTKQSVGLTLYLVQDGTGSRGVTFSATGGETFKFANGTTTSQVSSANDIQTVYIFSRYTGSANIYYWTLGPTFS